MFWAYTFLKNWNLEIIEPQQFLKSFGLQYFFKSWTSSIKNHKKDELFWTYTIYKEMCESVKGGYFD